MKKLLSSLLTVAFLSVLFVVSSGSKAKAQDVTVSYQTFYDELSPYGQWIYDPEYGNVWVPNEDGDFRPYGSRGRWAMTEYGNTWVSDDPWGWACYHYGRWTYNSYYGWMWVPGYEWAPAWVSWRYGGGYCGWAPLSPGVSIGVSYGCPDSWWVFVGPQYLYRTDYYRYWRGPRYNGDCIRRTSWYNNVYTDNYTRVQYNYGPRASAIERYTHQPVQVYRVSSSRRPGAQPIQQNTVSIYRPNVNRGTYTTSRPANVIQAPRNIGRPEAHSELAPSRQPAFRQEVVRRNAENPRNTGVVGPRNANNNQAEPVRGNSQPRFDTRNDARGNQAEPVRGNSQPRMDTRNDARSNQAEPVRGNSQPRFDNRDNPQSQPRRPEPARFEPQQPRNNPQPPTQPRVEPQRTNPQPQAPRAEPARQEPPRMNPQPQRQEPQRTNPQPQAPRAEPARQEPPRMNPQPQRQEPPRMNPQPARQEPPRMNPQPARQEPPRMNPQPQQPRPQPQQPQPAPRQQPQPGGRR